MRQESHSPNATAMSDLMLLLLLFALLFSAGGLMRLARSYAAWTSIVLFLAVVGLMFVLYRRRLVSYRYTLCYQAPEEDAFGDLPKLPFPLHTLTLERTTSGKTNEMETILLSDILALGDDGPVSTFPAPVRTLRFARNKKQALPLTYRHGDETVLALFAPSPELLALLKAQLQVRD